MSWDLVDGLSELRNLSRPQILLHRRQTGPARRI
jgi:hypothetical protein